MNALLPKMYVNIQLDSCGTTQVWYAMFDAILLHEYSHVVQYQLTRNGGVERPGPRWFTEGQARWLERAYAIPKGRTTWSQEKDWHQALYRSQVNAGWRGHYVGPFLVLAKLMEDYDHETWTDVWRSVFAMKRGIGGDEACDGEHWRESMESVYGMSWHDLSDLVLSATGVNIGDLPPDNPLEEAEEESNEPPAYCGRLISGVLVDGDGDPIADAELGAFRTSGGGNTLLAYSEANGEFAALARGDGNYELMANVRGCRVYFTGEGASATRQGRIAIQVEGYDITGLLFRIPDGLCEFRISGVISNADGSPVDEAWMTADGSVGQSQRGYIKRRNFEMFVPEPGEYRLNAWVEGCHFYYKEGGATLNRDEATPITIDDADVSGIEFVLPPDPASLCE